MFKFNVQYALENCQESFEMFDFFMAKSVQNKYKTMYSTLMTYYLLIL